MSVNSKMGPITMSIISFPFQKHVVRFRELPISRRDIDSYAEKIIAIIFVTIRIRRRWISKRKRRYSECDAVVVRLGMLPCRFDQGGYRSVRL